jgi:hypothetical protein
MDKDIEVRKLELEERRLEEELQLKKKELELQTRQFEARQEKKGVFGQIFSPVGVAVIGAIVGLLGTAASGLINSYIESKKQEANLILKTSEISDEKQRARNLLFYAEFGYLNFSPEYKEKLRETAGLKKGQEVPPPSTTVNFVPSAALTPELQTRLEKAIEDFRAYEQKIGFEITAGKVDVKITSGEEAATDEEYRGQIAYYDASSNLIAVESDYADDANVVFRQYAHYILMNSNATIPNNNNGYFAIESGLASYFPCSFSNHPMIGDNSGAARKGLFKPHNLINSRKFGEVSLSDWASVQADGSEVWGGAFWELRQLLTKDVADKLLYAAWVRLDASTHRNDPYLYFAKVVLDTDNSLEGGKNIAGIKEIFKRRGLTL